MQATTPREFQFQGFTCRFGSKHSEWPTHAQAEVVAGLAAGKTHKEIAKLRGVSPSTIKSMVSTVYYHLGKYKATSAVSEALKRGWIAPLLLALVISGLNTDAEALRHRQPTRTRTQVSASRTVSRRDVGSIYT